MNKPNAITQHVDSLLGSCRRRCITPAASKSPPSALRLLAARIHARASAEDGNPVRGSRMAHNDAYWSDIEDLVVTPVRSVDDPFAKVRAGQTMWRFELRAGEPFHELLRDLIAEGRTVEERLLYAVLADVSELASRSLR